MRSEKRRTLIKEVELSSFRLGLWSFSFSLLAFFSVPLCRAVTSKIVRHSSSADFIKGQTEDVVVGSKGTLRLGRAWQMPVEEFENVWSINTIEVNGGEIFIGTSPNGGIFKYSLGELTKIYPVEPEQQNAPPDNPQPDAAEEPNDANIVAEEPNDANIVAKEQHLANEHIFAMASDVAGRLLAGISGEKCGLLRFDADKIETIFEPNDAKYIFAIACDDKGNIYLGTGPEGKVYRFDPFDPAGTGLVYDSRDKNILSLTVGQDGFVYAGSDVRGLIYKINPKTKTATVLYDSEQPEVTALLLAETGELYAAATSAKITQAETKFAAQLPFAGKPETKSKAGKGSLEGGRKLEIPNTKNSGDDKTKQRVLPVHKPTKPSQASYIYKITKEGYVTDIFSENAVFFTLAAQKDSLLIGTGNSGQLYTVEPDTEQNAIIYEDKQASQITAVAVSGQDVYLGTANPARLIKLNGTFAPEGTYSSDLLDAGQPAKWGKLQIEADIPKDCEIMVASRSGNVKDINDPTFSDWTEPVEVTGPTQLRCPPARFCQYKLVLQSQDGLKSPLVRAVAVAGTVPNLAPKVESVSVTRIQAPGQTGQFKITYKAEDENQDKLTYKIDFRKLGRTSWIELKDQLEVLVYQWDGKTVEDGRYEVRVTASDERSNTTVTKLTGTRISEPVIVDNTGPVIEQQSIEQTQDSVTLKLRVSDEFSAIGQVDYTVDSNNKWKGTVPEDLVYDTTSEDFTIVIKDLKPAEHIIAVKAGDQVGNTTYKTFEVGGASD